MVEMERAFCILTAQNEVRDHIQELNSIKKKLKTQNLKTVKECKKARTRFQNLMKEKMKINKKD